MSREAVCAAAQEEGTLVQWSGIDEEVGVALFEAFSETAPGLELEYLSISSDDGVARIITEAAAGRTSVDFINGPPQDLFPLFDRDLVEDVDWDALGVNPDLVNSQGLIVFNQNGQGVLYNTELVGPDELPTTWEDLLDPKWGGKIVVDPRGRPFDGLSLAWGEEQTLDYVRRLKELNPILIEGGTSGMVAVGGGEAPLTTSGLTIETREQQDLGAPVDIQYLDVVSIRDSRGTVLKDAPHLNAAMCYGAWLGSDEGQKAVQDIYMKGARLQLDSLPETTQVVVPETPEDAESMESVINQVAEILTSG